MFEQNSTKNVPLSTALGAPALNHALFIAGCLANQNLIKVELGRLSSEEDYMYSVRIIAECLVALNLVDETDDFPVLPQLMRDCADVGENGH